MKDMMIGTFLSALLLAGAVPAQAQSDPAPAASPAAQAAPPAFPADAKVGFIDMQYVVSQSKLGLAGQEKIQALADKQNLDRVSRNNELQKLQQEIQAGVTVLSPQVLSEKRAELDKLTRQAQFEEEQRQADLTNLNTQLLTDFEEKVMPIIEAIRAERGLWVILTPSTDGSGVAAINPAINLSQEVVRRLDEGS
jgi:Skp family chaperone for outer membrane proteins